MGDAVCAGLAAQPYPGLSIGRCKIGRPPSGQAGAPDKAQALREGQGCGQRYPVLRAIRQHGGRRPTCLL